MDKNKSSACKKIIIMGDANLDSNNLGLLLEFATQQPWLDTLKIDNIKYRKKYFNYLMIDGIQFMHFNNHFMHLEMQS